MQLAESIKPQILEYGLQSEREYVKMYEGLKALSRDKGSFVTYSRLFSASGRNKENKNRLSAPAPRIVRIGDYLITWKITQSLFIVRMHNNTDGGGDTTVTFYETTNGRINSIEFPSEKPASDTLLCIHGLCCDARLFTYVGNKLSSAGYNVVSIDLPGHGMSDGKRGDLILMPASNLFMR